MELDVYACYDASAPDLAPLTYVGIGWATSRTGRSVELVVALLLLPIAAVIILAAGLVSALAVRAWPFFAQESSGLCDAPVWVFKVRSLPTHVPARFGKH